MAWLQSSLVSASVTTILLSILDTIVVVSTNWPTWWGGLVRDCPSGCKETIVLAQTCCKVVALVDAHEIHSCCGRNAQSRWFGPMGESKEVWHELFNAMMATGEPPMLLWIFE